MAIIAVGITPKNGSTTSQSTAVDKPSVPADIGNTGIRVSRLDALAAMKNNNQSATSERRMSERVEAYLGVKDPMLAQVLNIGENPALLIRKGGIGGSLDKYARAVGLAA